MTRECALRSLLLLLCLWTPLPNIDCARAEDDTSSLDAIDVPGEGDSNAVQFSGGAGHFAEFTADEVAKHNKEDDCWVTLNSQVLDVTDFLDEHPGGKKAIMRFAGKDASEEFNRLHNPGVILRHAPECVVGAIKGEVNKIPEGQRVAEGDKALGSAELEERKGQILEMFRHAYDGYMKFGFPHDELRPLTCDGTDPLGGYGVQLVDVLPSLRVVGLLAEFEDAVIRCEQLDFDRDVTVSVFETNIRTVGGLISGHLLALETDFSKHTYNDGLLRRAVDMADRLLPAFDETATGIPVRSVNLRHGVPDFVGEHISSAEAGTFSLEFGVLSHLTGDLRYREAAERAVDAVWKSRVKKGLIGSQLDAFTGKMVRSGIGKWLVIGSGVDSYYEYLLKSEILFGNRKRGNMFRASQRAITRYLKQGPWYIGLNVNDLRTIDPVFRNLDAYWPGVLVLAGEEHASSAAETLSAMMDVAQQFDGTTPELYDIHTKGMMFDDTRYQLRPELAESLFYMYNHSQDDKWLRLAEVLVDGLENCRTTCGFASLDVAHRQKLDSMETFVLSETLTYLFLIFDPSNDLLQKRGLVFSTEGHPLWLP